MPPSNHHSHNNSSSISNLLTKSCSKYFALDSKNFTSPPPLPLPTSTNKPTGLNEQKHLVSESSTTITTNSNPHSSRLVSNFSNPVPVKLDSSATNQQQQQQPIYVPSLSQPQLSTSNYPSANNNFIYSTNQPSSNQYMPYHHHETNMTPYYSQPDNRHLQYSTTNDLVYYKASPNNTNSTSFAAAYFGNETSLTMQCNDDNINNKAQSKVNKVETSTGSLLPSSSSCNSTYQDNSNSSLETDLGSLDNYVTNDPTTTVNNVSSGGGSATFGNIVMNNSSGDCYAYQNKQFIAQYSASYHHQHHHHHHSNNQHSLPPFDKSGYSLVNAVPSCENNIIF
jgi:hypothetical protein